MMPQNIFSLTLKLQRDVKTGQLSEDVYTQQAVEMLTALKKLGETVSLCLIEKTILTYLGSCNETKLIFESVHFLYLL
jgi:hypothetical protein